MVTAFYHFDVFMRELGYKPVKGSQKHKKTYFKVENTTTEHICKLVVCLDLLGAKIFTNEGIQTVKEIASSQFDGTTTDNVLVIALDRKGTTDIHTNNVILYNRDVLRLHGKTSKLFESDFEHIKNNLKERQREDAHRKALWFHNGKYYSTTIIYLMVAGLFASYVFLTKHMTDLYGISADSVYRDGESYRLISYVLSHASISHLLSNCTSLFIIGRMYAKKRNFLDVLIVFFGGGIISGLCSISYNMVTYNTAEITVGASGAILAILGALLVNVFMDTATIGFRKEYVKYAIVTLVLSSIGFKIDHACHITGFVSGMTIEYLLTKADNIYAYTKFIETRDKRKTSL